MFKPCAALRCRKVEKEVADARRSAEGRATRHARSPHRRLLLMLRALGSLHGALRAASCPWPDGRLCGQR